MGSLLPRLSAEKPLLLLPHLERLPPPQTDLTLSLQPCPGSCLVSGIKSHKLLVPSLGSLSWSPAPTTHLRILLVSDNIRHFFGWAHHGSPLKKERERHFNALDMSLVLFYQETLEYRKILDVLAACLRPKDLLLLLLGDFFAKLSSNLSPPANVTKYLHSAVILFAHPQSFCPCFPFYFLFFDNIRLSDTRLSSYFSPESNNKVYVEIKNH